MSEQVYKTSDQGFAAYLLEKGFWCAKAIPANNPAFPDKMDFVFIDVDDPKTLEDDYFRFKVEPMSAYSYFIKTRTLRRILRNNGMTKEEFEALKKEQNGR